MATGGRKRQKALPPSPALLFMQYRRRVLVIHLVAAFLLIALFIVALATRGFTSFSERPEDSLVFFSHPDCASCAEQKSIAEGIAASAGIGFKEATYPSPEFVPAFAVFTNGYVLIAPFRGREVVEQQVRGFVDDHKKVPEK